MMTLTRRNQILAIVLAVQVALSLFVFWPRSAATGQGELLFGDLETGEVVALAITDDQGAQIALGKSGDEWVLPEADDYPVQASKITSMLDRLLQLDTGRLVTRTEASHKRLQTAADDFARRLDLETAAGERYTLYLGSSPSYGAVHFRLDGQDETYLTDQLSAWEVYATAASWVDTNYFTYEQASLTRVTLENANGTFVFNKDEQGNWTWTGLKAGEELATAAVTTVVNRATSITLLKPLGKEQEAAYGLEAPLATVTLEGEGKTITVLVGAKDPADNSYVVKVSESPYYVRVSEFSAKPLVEDARDTFVQLPPTPEG